MQHEQNINRNTNRDMYLGKGKDIGMSMAMDMEISMRRDMDMDIKTNRFITSKLYFHQIICFIASSQHYFRVLKS
jgi:hypothetical protein